MSAQSTAGSGTRRRFSYHNPDLRISDAERAEVADRLSKHYGDGRLDQAEFNQRLDQAMRAKTQADLSGLFADLPRTDAEDPVVRQQHRHVLRRIFLLGVVIVSTAIAWHALARSYVPWLLIGVLAFLWLRHGPRRHQHGTLADRHSHDHPAAGEPSE